MPCVGKVDWGSNILHCESRKSPLPHPFHWSQNPNHSCFHLSFERNDVFAGISLIIYSEGSLCNSEVIRNKNNDENREEKYKISLNFIN